jgi:virginiamycin B lyase
MSIRRLLLVLLAVGLIAPVGLFIRHEWREGRICQREFGVESTQYEICVVLPAQPGVLRAGPGGDLWFIERSTNSVGRISPDREIRRYPIPTTTGRDSSGSGPLGTGRADLTFTADGSVWFLEPGADRVGRITQDGKVTEVPLYGPNDGYLLPEAITAAPDGSVWVAAGLGGRVVRIDGRTLAVRNFTVQRGGTVFPHSVAADREGGVWFERPSASAMDPKGAGPALGRLTSTGRITYHPLPGTGRSEPGSLSTGPDGAVWFLDAPGGVVGRMTSDGTLTEFPLPGAPTLTSGTGLLATGRDVIWFAGPQGGAFGRITCD